MPDKPIQPPSKPSPEQKPVQKPATPPVEKPQGQKKPEGKKTPAQKKDEGLKYEMKYVNGGFNNGVQIKPDKDGKALVEISIYGGGTKKTLSIGPLPSQISKLIKAYEVSATQGQNTPEITGELQKYFENLNTTLSQKIIEIMMDMDSKVESAIRETFKK
jgi:hypothetical protein